MMSYSVFCCMRPFWIVAPSEHDRDTCQCKAHENLSFLATKLKNMNLLTSHNFDDLVDVMLTISHPCTMNVVPARMPSAVEMPAFDKTTRVSWTQWKIQ